MTISRRIAFIIFLIVLTGRPFPAQQKAAAQDEGLKLKTDLIELKAVVTDKKGQPVDNLRQEDFELLEDKKPRQISFFSVERPGSGSAREQTAGPARSQVRAPEPPARTVILVADVRDMSISSLMQSRTALKKFVHEKLTDRDMAAVVTTGRPLGMMGRFTRDRQMLLRAVDCLAPWGAGSRSRFSPLLASRVLAGDSSAIYVAMMIMQDEGDLFMPRTVPSSVINDSIRKTVEAQARMVLIDAERERLVVLETIRAAAERLAKMPGQRVIALLSDGFSMLDSTGNPDRGRLSSVVDAAVRSGVVIYSINSSGLGGALQDGDASARSTDPAILNNPTYRFAVSNARVEAEGGISSLAYDTGGEYFHDTNDIAGAVGRVVDNNQVYYNLAYYLEDAGQDPGQHRITIRIRNNPGYKVRTQKYFVGRKRKNEKEEPAKSPQQELADAMGSPLPATDIVMAATARFMQTEDPKNRVQVVVKVDMHSLTLSEDKATGRISGGVEYVVMVFNEYGRKIDLVSDNITLSLPPGSLEKMRENLLVRRKSLALNPGNYHILVGMRELATERRGTGYLWLEVPDLGRKKLATSDIFLSEVRNRKLNPVPENGVEEQARELVGPEYCKAGNLLVYALKVYNIPDNLPADKEPVVQVELLNQEKQIFTTPWTPVSRLQISRDRLGALIGGQLQMNLTPGLYELRVTTRQPGSKRIVRQSEMFGVE